MIREIYMWIVLMLRGLLMRVVASVWTATRAPEGPLGGHLSVLHLFVMSECKSNVKTFVCLGERVSGMGIQRENVRVPADSEGVGATAQAATHVLSAGKWKSSRGARGSGVCAICEEGKYRKV